MFSRKFTLRHTFDTKSDLDEDEGPVETHFGIPWEMIVDSKDKMRMKRWVNHISVYLKSQKDVDEKRPWSVSVKATCRFDSGNEQYEQSFKAKYHGRGCYGLDYFREWDYMMENYVENDKVTVVMDVDITEMRGFSPKRKISFDEPEADISDVVLAVGDRKFHVSKVILGKFSDFFKLLFFTPGYKESKQSEIKLEEVNPDTFQMLLEVIYGELDSIQGETVEDILQLADQYQVAVAIKRCGDFMIDKADVPLDKKFRLASTYNLVDLQDHLLEDIKSKKDSDARLTESSKDMSDSFIAKMIRKVYE